MYIENNPYNHEHTQHIQKIVEFIDAYIILFDIGKCSYVLYIILKGNI